MKQILLTLRIEVWVFLLGLVVIIGYRMLTGAIKTKGLLSDKSSRSGFSPARLQLLIATLATAFYYIGEIPTSAQEGVFPTVPKEMILILGGSHAFYLGSKVISLITESLGRLKK
jgi:hypothetical protein